LFAKGYRAKMREIIENSSQKIGGLGNIDYLCPLKLHKTQILDLISKDEKAT